MNSVAAVIICLLLGCLLAVVFLGFGIWLGLR